MANAYLVQVTRVFARVCGLLAKEQLGQQYTAQAEKPLERFRWKYITPEGQIMANSRRELPLPSSSI